MAEHEPGPIEPETALVPAGLESLVKIEKHITNFHSKAESAAKIMLVDVGLSLVKAFTGPLGSIIGDVCAKVEAKRLAQQLRFFEARLEALEETDLTRAQSDEVQPLVKEMLRMGLEASSDQKRSLYVDAFVNIIKAASPVTGLEFRAFRTLAEVEDRHLSLLWAIRHKQQDGAGQFRFEPQDVEYEGKTNKLPEIHDLQSWGIIIPYQPDTSRTRASLTTLGRRVLSMIEPVP